MATVSTLWEVRVPMSAKYPEMGLYSIPDARIDLVVKRNRADCPSDEVVKRVLGVSDVTIEHSSSTCIKAHDLTGTLVGDLFCWSHRSLSPVVVFP